MKNLLDHFRRKPAQPAEEPVAAAAKPVAAPIKAARLQTAVARAVKPAWHAPAAPFPQKPRTPALADRALPAEMVTLRLGDFLDRIPAELLDAAGTPDHSIPMPFELSHLSERIGRGETTIRLAEVFRRTPDIFRSDAAIHTDRVIPFPWTKVLAMLREAKAGAADGGISPSGVNALAHKFKARKLRLPSKMAPVPRPVREAGPETAPDGAMSVAPQTGGLRLAEPAEPPVGTPELAQLRAERNAAVARAAEFGAEYDAAISRTGALAAERDAAVARTAELLAMRDAAAARIEKLVTDSQAAVTRAAELTASHEAAVARAAELTAQREAALARTAEPSAEHAATLARLAALTAERDAAVARAEKMAADHEAALALGTELSTARDGAAGQAAALAAERDAMLARLTAMTAERDAAAAHAEKMAADSDAALALGAELTTERDGLATRLAALTSERDAALSRIAELAAERDAAAARTAELLRAAETSRPTAAESPAATDIGILIEGYKNTIDALIGERDALRKDREQSAGKFTAKKIPASARAAMANDPLPDAYSSLFPARLWFGRAAAAGLLALLAVGIATQLPLGTAGQSEAAASADPAPAAEPGFSLPVLSEVSVPESRLMLETKPPVETMTLPPAEPLPSSTAALP